MIKIEDWRRNRVCLCFAVPGVLFSFWGAMSGIPVVSWMGGYLSGAAVLAYRSNSSVNAIDVRPLPS